MRFLLESLRELQRENAEVGRSDLRLAEALQRLHKDKERRDWLLSEDSNAHIEVGRYGRGNEYKPWVVDTIQNRSDIDKAMEDEV